MQIARPTKKKRRYSNHPGSQIFVPPPITPGQKPDSLDRRIRNIEALDNGIFIGNVLASFMALPGLVGFWPMSSVQRSTGNAYDLSGQSRTLTYNGNPAYSYYNGLVPYIGLDGTGDYLSRADETDLDILGSESIYTSGAAGLTLGGWFYFNSVAGTVTRLIGKEDNSTQLSYVIYESTTSVNFTISTNGTAFTGTVGSTGITIAVNTWYFIAGRFTPSTETAIFLNNSKTTNTTSIPATIFNSTSLFTIGSQSGGGNYLNGRAALCFLCANALSDELINSLFQQGRVLFAV